MFAYKEKVPWSEFAVVLNALFRNNTGRGLTQEHLEYLERLLPGLFLSTTATTSTNVKSITTFWPVLTSRPTEGRMPSGMHGWLVTCRGGMPARSRLPIPVRPPT